MMNILKRLFFTINAILIAGLSIAHDNTEIEMATGMLASGKIYVVVAVLTIIFLGLAIYLFLLDRRITKLESEIDKQS